MQETAEIGDGLRKIERLPGIGVSFKFGVKDFKFFVKDSSDCGDIEAYMRSPTSESKLNTEATGQKHGKVGSMVPLKVQQLENPFGSITHIVCEDIAASIHRFLLSIMDDRWETEVIEFGAINITGFRIVDSTRRYVKDFTEGWRRLDPTSSPGAGRDTISVREQLYHTAYI
ncbi:hypothetical protein AAG570_012221 [Ranatra chinensis]|uniref:Uncharacterized protein n=1 Tax=Ranatra chinensis TaxID=642074 RepID=A0ABD0YI56_9HEMI